MLVCALTPKTASPNQFKSCIFLLIGADIECTGSRSLTTKKCFAMLSALKA